MAEITDDLEVLSAELVEDRHSRARDDCLDGILDLRLFEWRGEIYAAGAGCNYRSYMEKKDPFPNHTMVLAKLNGHKLDIVTAFSSGLKTEKNWMPWIVDDELYFVYSPDMMLVLHYNPVKKSLKDVSSKKDERLELFRGGSNMVPVGDAFVGIVQARNSSEKKPRYKHRAFLASRDFERDEGWPRFHFRGRRCRILRWAGRQGGPVLFCLRRFRRGSGYT